MSGTGNNAVAVVGTTDVRINGLLGGTAWDSTSVTYGFPGNGADFGASYGFGEDAGAFAATAGIESASIFALDTADGNAANDGFAIEGFTAQDITAGTTGTEHIRISQTTSDPFGIGTAWGYLPSTASAGGDVWLSDVIYDFSRPVAGDYAWLTVLHEIGHSMGLKHGHDEDEDFGALPEDYDAMEYTIMSYHAYPEAPVLGYSNEQYGFVQSYMMLDIAALQYLYGANFTVNSGDTVYSWTPTSGDTLVNGVAGISPGANRIFATIWDGGGTDTYDLSAYSDNLKIDLAPGGFSVFSDTQLALLATNVKAQGNIYNALQYEGDPRSLIENAIGGSGNDRINGNQAANALTGNDGRDVLKGLGGDDTLVGNAGFDRLFGDKGNDTLFGGGSRDKLRGGQGNDTLNGEKGDDLLLGEGGNDTLNGDIGKDILIGGSGRDLLSGGRDTDVFRFVSVKDSRVGKNSDRILDFESGTDKIDLTWITTAPMTFETGDGFSGSGASVYSVFKKGQVRIMVDADGDGDADMRIWLDSQRADVSATDFLL